MEGEQNDMKEIKVMVFSGNLAELAKSSMKDVVLKDRFSQQQGYTVQQFSYSCKKERDEVGTTFGVNSGVVVDFTIRVMTNDQTLFYDKLKDLGNDYYSFIYNGVYEGGRLKYFDNAIMVDGYVVDVEECASNNHNQALMHVKLLARQLSYIHHDGNGLNINISNGE
jgi:hypothetical protein